jgi:hypothetical protein
MSRSRRLTRALALAAGLGCLSGCGYLDGPGGPSELPPENLAVAKSPPKAVKKARIPKNFIPGNTNRSLKGGSGD